MSVINILDKSVYNKIAAGEVVEKPSSVVKELVENSIDANATNIIIEIINGGIDQIKVTDNGTGIHKDDFDKVFMAHATSKLKNIEDLSKIGTLGFRGEALSSIASVSKVTLASKTNDDLGYQMKVIGGEIGEIEPIGATQGTYISVDDLFYNIPARKKFLRKPKLEENDITNYIARLIMANPHINFKYTADHKIIYQSFGTGLYDAIYAVYGKSIVDNIFEFSFNKGDFKFSGYLGKPTFSKPNRTYQTLLINGRYVINQTISTSVYKAYENFMMKGNFPFFVINLEIPLDKVDVNVHPNKLDVKFENSNQIFGIVYSNITEILYNINNTKSISTQNEVQEELVSPSSLNNVSKMGSEFSQQYETNNNDNTNEIKEVSLTDEVEYEINKEENHFESSSGLIDETYFNSNKTESNNIPFVSNKQFEFKVAEPISNNIAIQKNVINQETLNIDCDDFKIIGTFLNTYVLVERNEDLLFIDQHAGHERLLYDKFSKELENKQVAIQPLLIPFILETNYVESNFIMDNLETLTDLGFQIEEFGENAFKVSTVPVLMDSINIQDFFDKILLDIDNKLIVTNHQNNKHYLATAACKAAVKGKDILSDNEIRCLLDKLNNSNQVLLCPHGRPIIIDVNKKEIEKWFKRIV